MRPMHFGDSRAPLFGVLHEPDSPADWAVVLCPSWGMEYMRAYPALRELARQLAQHGIAALTFDYFGTGDSAGDGTESSLDHWLHDIAAAVLETRDATGVERICLLGLRLGALLAHQTLSLRLAQADALVLWDSPTTGGHFVSQMRRLDETLDAEKNRQRADDAQLPAQSDDELLGHAWPSTVSQAILNLPPPDTAVPRLRHRLSIHSQDKDSTMHGALTSAAHPVLKLPDAGNWDDVQRMTAPWLPTSSVRLIASHLSGWLP